MIVLISPETTVPQELRILDQMFEEELLCFHLRKPLFSIDEQRKYLDGINNKFLSRIVIHSHHSLRKEYGLRGIHFTEKDRISKEHDFQSIQTSEKGISFSSSFHHPTDIERSNLNLDYHFLSPVFTSISKKNYPGKEYNVNHIDRSIIALGGITIENALRTKGLGYNGIAVLGTVWQNETPLEVFTSLVNLYSKLEVHV